ncbi:hypothetical protein AKJ65_04865 [candidate division MSBL1 archaeon SCGC-AAA259E19]|uniref:Uncharacterized protein n=1 Tax=candidate division MSBL1 archaeon SCGC-AAA259E19 TaxID=1698264 RepID=A0A133UJA7_9EURY|nr:hypothetical protein AKJ65_04865 [candidate division MSBL1 archaeon SCGC-AAA259E19]
MTFKEFEKGRGRGKSYPLGFTKRKIILFIAQNFPEKVEEKKLRNYLEKEFEITGNTGIKRHLSDLEEKECIKKEYEPGIANYLKLNTNYDGFKSLCKLFLDSSDRAKFLKSDYAQEMLDDKFLRTQIEEFKEYLRENKVLEDNVMNWVDIFLDNYDIFRKFPIGLYYLLFPSELEEELSVFKEMAEEKEEQLDQFANLFVQNVTQEQIEKWEKMLDLAEQRIGKMRERFETIKQKWEEGEIGDNSYPAVNCSTAERA